MNVSGAKVVVIGAGIVGAGIAFQLAFRGARVTLVDKERPASGVTGKAFAWLNASYGVATENVLLRQQALAEYHRLQGQLNNKLKVNWCGALTWSDRSVVTERFIQDHSAVGSDVRRVDAAGIRKLEPGLLDVPDCAAYSAGEGAVDPAEVTDILVQAALEYGADLIAPCVVSGFESRGSRVVAVRCGKDRLDADVVVLAAGAETSTLCGAMGIYLPINSSPAILLRFKTSGRLVSGIVSNPEFEIRQFSGNVMLAAEDYIDDSLENGPDAIAVRALSAIQRGLSGSESVQLEAVSVGIRPIPEDGSPIIGYCPDVDNLYIASAHAGITLAPIVGRYAAMEILGQQQVEALKSYRPERFGLPATD